MKDNNFFIAGRIEEKKIFVITKYWTMNRRTKLGLCLLFVLLAGLGIWWIINSCQTSRSGFTDGTNEYVLTGINYVDDEETMCSSRLTVDGKGYCYANIDFSQEKKYKILLNDKNIIIKEAGSVDPKVLVEMEVESVDDSLLLGGFVPAKKYIINSLSVNIMDNAGSELDIIKTLIDSDNVLYLTSNNDLHMLASYYDIKTFIQRYGIYFMNE